MKVTVFIICLFTQFAASAQLKTVSLKEDLPPVPAILNSNDAIKRFSSVVATKTISCADSSLTDYAPYLQLIRFLQLQYPLVHQRLERKIINKYSLLYCWQGSNSNLAPDLYISHYDVVPVEQHSLDKWIFAPFDGVVDSGYIWGRGSVDAKFQMTSLLEAAEVLLKENFTPERTVYFAFGHDEETGGKNGAAKISEYLQGQQLHFNMILDEGGGIAEGIFPGVIQPIAFIGISEKGFMNVSLTVEKEGGHSSAPQAESPITILSEGISRLNKNPMPSRLNPATQEMLETLKPYMSRKKRFALNNEWLFRKKILRSLSEDPISNALVRTSISPTMIQGGVKENSLPSYASANLNVRIMPGDSPESIQEYIIKTMNDDRIKLSTHGVIKNAGSIASSSCPAYITLKKTILQHFPKTLVSPVICIATTDSHHYSGMSESVLRFIPAIIKNKEKQMVHGENERISISNYMESIHFYHDLIKTSAGNHPG